MAFLVMSHTSRGMGESGGLALEPLKIGEGSGFTIGPRMAVLLTPLKQLLLQTLGLPLYV